jgi:L-lysine exporter family protein LysE/ArgO
MTLAGAGFLACYGVMALARTAAPAPVAVADGGGLTLGQALAATAAFTLLNPHVYLDTVLLMGAAGSAQPPDARPLFVAGAVAASFAWFAALGFGARLLAPLFVRPGTWRVLDGVVGGTMLALAGSLVLGLGR